MLTRRAVAVLLLASGSAVTVRAADVSSVVAPEARSTPVEDLWERRHSAPGPDDGVLPRAPLLRLVWMDPTNAAGASARAARAEVTRLFAPFRVEVLWREAVAGVAPTQDDLDEIQVVLLDRPGAVVRGRGALGSTPRQPGGSRHSWVHVPSVLAALGAQSPHAMPLSPGRRRDVGLALGRVIAHELVHAIAPEVPHGSGLMKDQLTASELTARTIAVPAVVGGAVRSALSGGSTGVQIAATGTQ